MGSEVTKRENREGTSRAPDLFRSVVDVLLEAVQSPVDNLLSFFALWVLRDRASEVFAQDDEWFHYIRECRTSLSVPRRPVTCGPIDLE